MTPPFQRWAPTKTEAELLVDMLTARLEPAKIAKTLYIDARTLKAYLTRLQAAAAAPCPESPPLPAPATSLPAPARVLADRVFSRETPIGSPVEDGG